MRKYKVTLENWDGKCKRVALFAIDEFDAFGIAQQKYPAWVPVKAKLQ